MEPSTPSENSSAATQAMTLEEARTKIRETLNLIIGENDPVMLFVVLEQAFLEIRENQFKTQMIELSKVIEESSRRHDDAVNESLRLLTDEALKGSLENTLAAVSEKAKNNDRLETRIRAHGRVIWLATGLIWLAVGTLFFIL